MAITMDVGMISELVRTLGIVISGLWVAWTFHKLQQTRAAEVKIGRDLAETEKAVADSRKAAAETNKALADSQKALTDTRKASAEVIDLERRQLSQQPNLEIAFVEIIEHRTSDQPPDVFLSVAIEVRNVGSRNLQMNFSETALTVGRFDLRDKHLQLLSDVERIGPSSLPKEGERVHQLKNRLLLAGQHRQMGFVMPIQTHGLYLIEFKALYTVFPFQGGEEISGEELERYAINALEQTVVAVGMDGSKVLTPTSASTTSNAAGELSNRA